MSMPMDVNVRVLGAANAKTQLTGVGNSMQQVGTKADMMNKRLAANKSNIRGLAIGLSTVFGTITGVVAEFQLLGDAQQKVAKDTELLNKLQAEGKKGTTEWSRAQASLAKDMRFLSFSTRNLALVLANFIPEAILIATSLANMRRAQALYKLQVAESIAANQGLSASNAKLVVSNTTLATSQRLVATSATPLGNIMRINAGVMASGISPLANLNRNLLATRVGMDATAVASTRLTKAFRLLKIASVVLIPLVALEIGSQAFKNNWGGFADIINGIGKSIGDAVPQLRGFLDVLGKIGRSIVAIFTGDFEDIGKIWGGTAEDIEDINQDLIKSIEELDKSSQDFVLSLAEMDKKERSSELFNLGIKGGTEKRIKKVLDGIQKLKETATDFTNAMMTIRQLNVLKDFGFKGIPDTFEKIFFTMESKFKNRKKLLEKGSLGRDIFKGLEDIMRKAAKDPGHAPEIIANYLANHGEIINFLKANGMSDEAETLKAIADEALMKALKSTSAEVETPGLEESLGLVTDAGKNPFGLLIQKFKDFTTKDLPALVDEMGRVLVDPATWINAINSAGAGLTLIGTAIWNFIKQPLIDFTHTIDPLISVLFDSNTWINAINSIGSQLLLVGTAVWNFIKSGIINVFNDPIGALSAVATAIQTGLQIAFEALTSVDWIGGAIAIVNGLAEGFKALFPKTAEQLGKDVEGFNKLGQSIWSGILAGISNIPDLAKQLLDLLINKFGAGIGSLFGFQSGSNGQPIIQPVSDDKNGNADPFGLQMAWMVVNIALAKEKIVQLFKEIEVAAQQLQTGLANLAIQGTNSLGILAAGSSTAANGIDANLSVAEVAAQDLQTGLANLSNEGIKSMAALAHESSVMANGIKNNMKVAETAVNSLRDAINSLKSKTVTVKVQVSNSKAEGGLMSFAEGGLMSAAKGRMFTAHGEQLVKVGDNPGGNETVAFIPHNNPYPIVDRILEMFGTRANAGGAFGRSRMGGGNNAPIIVQVYMDNQRMENHLVKTVTRRVAAFK